jgi:hypothetical protein
MSRGGGEIGREERYGKYRREGEELSSSRI